MELFKSQTMRNVLAAMADVEARWDNAEEWEKPDLINPDAPMIVQCGDFGYEVQSIGGDGDLEGFVMCLKAKPVCEWRGLQCIKLPKK